MAEYVVPHHGKEPGVTGGTMPKAGKEKGGLFAEVNRLAGSVPGPEKYHKDILEQNFVGRMKGGKFSGMGRDWPKSPRAGTCVAPSVGTYQVDAAVDKIKPRAPGGQISKNDRKCFFAQQAARNTLPPPGKYDPKTFSPHIDTPVFASPRTESRSPKKQSPMGPGYYNPEHTIVEKKVLSYSGSKESSKSFLDKLMSSKDKTPPPGHVGIPTSRWEDTSGRAMHACRLLLDRPVVPRPGRAVPGVSPNASPRM
jgi:hypothetical protein